MFGKFSTLMVGCHGFSISKLVCGSVCTVNSSVGLILKSKSCSIKVIEFHWCLQLWPEIPVISTKKTPFIKCTIPLITTYN